MDDATKEFGDGIQNDHSYDFYKSLCYLQLNQYDDALKLMQIEIEKTKNKVEKIGSRLFVISIQVLSITKNEITKKRSKNLIKL